MSPYDEIKNKLKSGETSFKLDKTSQVRVEVLKKMEQEGYIVVIQKHHES
jgi:ribosomal protein S8